MKSFLDRVFSRRSGQPRHTIALSGLSSELIAGDIENYYVRIIADCLRRLLVPPDSLEVGVRRAGVGPTGLTAYAGYVRIVKWDPVHTPVLLQNLSVIDARIRKTVEASVILEHTHFEGIWFQSTCRTEGAPRQLVGLPPEPLVHTCMDAPGQGKG
jgi:hypothetical protein